MIEAKDEERAYIIPIVDVLEKVRKHEKSLPPPSNPVAVTEIAEKQPSKTLDVHEIIVKGNDRLASSDYEAAIIEFNKVLSDPNYALIWRNKGFALNQLKEYKEAIKCFDRAIEIDPNDPLSWYNKAFALNNLKEYKEAIKCLDRSIEIDPNNPASWNNKGFALNQLKKYKEAIKCLDRSIEINPQYSRALNNKGFALNQLKKYK